MPDLPSEHEYELRRQARLINDTLTASRHQLDPD